MQDIRPEHFVFSGQRIDQHFRAGCAVGEIIERMSKNLTTMGDIDAFAKFISEIYQTGYLKAVKDYEESLNKLGYKVKLTPATPENKIFSQEKSG